MAESSQVCKKRRFDAAFKLKVIEFAEQNTNRGAARKYGIDESEFVSGRSKGSAWEPQQQKKET